MFIYFPLVSLSLLITNRYGTNVVMNDIIMNVLLEGNEISNEDEEGSEQSEDLETHRDQEEDGKI